MPAIIHTNSNHTARSTHTFDKPGKQNHRSFSFVDVRTARRSESAERLSQILVARGVDPRRAPLVGEALHTYIEQMLTLQESNTAESSLRVDPRRSILRHYFFYDRTERPIAMCVKERRNKYGAFKIYGSEPLFNDQPPLLFESGVNLFPWFRISCREVDGGYEPVVCIWRFSKFRPMRRSDDQCT